MWTPARTRRHCSSSSCRRTPPSSAASIRRDAFGGEQGPVAEVLHADDVPRLLACGVERADERVVDVGGVVVAVRLGQRGEPGEVDESDTPVKPHALRGAVRRQQQPPVSVEHPGSDAAPEAAGRARSTPRPSTPDDPP